MSNKQKYKPKFSIFASGQVGKCWEFISINWHKLVRAWVRSRLSQYEQHVSHDLSVKCFQPEEPGFLHHGNAKAAEIRTPLDPEAQEVGILEGSLDGRPRSVDKQKVNFLESGERTRDVQRFLFWVFLRSEPFFCLSPKASEWHGFFGWSWFEIFYQKVDHVLKMSSFLTLNLGMLESDVGQKTWCFPWSRPEKWDLNAVWLLKEDG